MSKPRIITGSAKGQRLEVPDRGTRPMTDRVKSALFSMINPLIKDSEVIDLFAGTGALGIECLSRGAKKVTFIDKSKIAVACIRNNLRKTGFESKSAIIKAAVSRVLNNLEEFKLKKTKFDIVFFTPPYNSFKEKTLSKTGLLIHERGVIIAEHSKTRKLEDNYVYQLDNSNKSVEIERIEDRTYGITSLSFYKLI